MNKKSTAINTNSENVKLIIETLCDKNRELNKKSEEDWKKILTLEHEIRELQKFAAVAKAHCSLCKKEVKFGEDGAIFFSEIRVEPGIGLIVDRVYGRSSLVGGIVCKDCYLQTELD